MKLTRLFTYAILAMLLLACESTNEPSSNGEYNFSSLKSEKAVVYGEGGKVIPQSEWYSDISDSYENFQSQMNNIKLYKFEKGANSIKLYTEFGIFDVEYSMLGDTIIMKGGEFEEEFIPWGIVVNSNTIELHFNEIGYGFSVGSNFGYSPEGMWMANDPDISDISENEIIAHFRAVFVFKK